MEYNFVSAEKLKADHGTTYLMMPSFVQGDNVVRAYKICNGDYIEYPLEEFLKPLNINMFMNNKFEVIRYGRKKDFWTVKLFGKIKYIHKPFCWIKTVTLRYIGE